MKENFPELGIRQRLSINYFDQEYSYSDAAIINIFKFTCTRSIDPMSEQNDGFRKSKRPLSRNIFFRWLPLLANVYVPIAFICHSCLCQRFLLSFFSFYCHLHLYRALSRRSHFRQMKIPYARYILQHRVPIMQQRNPKVMDISTNFSFLIHKRGPMFRQ